MEILFESPFGKFILGFSGDTLTSLRLAENLPPGLTMMPEDEANEIVTWLQAYFAGRNPSTSGLNFKAKGSTFQERVWKMLGEIPYGYCVTYGFLSQLLAPGTRKSRLLARAVGNALASNPIWIIIPCHRVIRANGEIGNYAGGKAMKYALLKIEGANIPNPFSPNP